MPSLAVISYNFFLTNAFFRWQVSSQECIFVLFARRCLEFKSCQYWLLETVHSLESDKTGYSFACCLPPLGFSGDAVVKKLPANAGDSRDMDSIPGSERSTGVENGNPFQYSYLENSMDRGAWRATVHGVTESDMTEHIFMYCPFPAM